MKKYRNREFVVVAYSFVALFLALIIYFAYFQIAQSEDIINNAYNKRQNNFAKSIVRGDILAEDGTVLATTKVDSDGDEVRLYPYSNMFAHVVGYSTNGYTGMESIANFNLLRSHSFILTRLMNELKGDKNQGDNVYTTLDCNVQKAAYEALNNYDGAVIALEPKTGKILGMVSKPDYDPNTIAKEWDDIVSDADSSSSILFNRATQGSYTPGSTFKIFTTLEYIRENGDYEDFSYNCVGSTTVDGYTIHCFDSEVHGKINLEEAFAESCNSAYATIGLSLNLNKFKNFCSTMLFNKELPIAYPYTKSSFKIDNDSSTAAVMQASIGQEQTTVSPLHMALVASAIANNGVLMNPYIIDHTANDEDITVEEFLPTEYGKLITKGQASIMQEYMEETVRTGTATKLQSDRYTAAGKTGSAQVSDTSDDTHSWFVGYAKDGEKEIAIAVIVEKQGNGSRYAVPIAKAVFDAYFK